MVLKILDELEGADGGRVYHHCALRRLILDAKRVGTKGLAKLQLDVFQSLVLSVLALGHYGMQHTAAKQHTAK